MMSGVTTINLAKDFTPYPFGRFRTQGPGSGEEFREMIEAVLARGDEVIVDLDGVRGCPSSFLEEVFGGLVRSASQLDLTVDELAKRIKVVSEKTPVLVTEANRYLKRASAG